jgi:site-specific recombinase XerD
MLSAMTSSALALTSPVDLASLVERAKEYAADARASSTRRAYLADFRVFEAWCAAQGLTSMPAPPSVVAVYLTHLADSGRKVATLERALTGIVHAHRSRGFDWPRAHPAIANVMAGIRRRLGSARAQKAPVVDELLAAMVATLDEDLRGRRDRALLTLGWAGAFRRSELVALTVADVARTSEGLIATVRRSKGDQEGKGAEKGIPYASRGALCPVRSLDGWLAAAGITEGPIFRYIDRHGRMHGDALSDRSVARIVQRTAARAGLDAATVAGHSLRAGFATTAAKRGKSLDAIMRQTLHKSERVARSYIRHAKLFDDNAAVGLL